MAATESAPGAPVAPAGATRRAVHALLLAQFAMTCGMVAGVTALGKQVFDLMGRELDLGLLGLAEFAPAAVLVFVTGSVADRFNRGRVAAVGTAAMAAVSVVLAVLAHRPDTGLGAILLTVVALGSARAFVGPSSRSLAADLVEPEQLAWLIPRVSATYQVGSIVGPVVAGFLYAVDPTAPFLAMTGLLVLAAAGFTTVRVPRSAVGHGDAPAERPRLRDAFDGLRFIRGHPILLGAISLDLFAVLFGGAVILLPAIAEERLGVGAVGLGWLRAAVGIGAGLTTLVLARRPVQRHVGRVLLFVVGLFGVGTVVLGLTRNYALAFVALGALSAADSVSVFIRSTLVPLVTPAATRGRVLAVEMVFIGASNELGGFESGVAGQLLGVSGAVVVGGLATLLIAAAWWAAFPGLRDVDRFPAAAGP